MIRGGHYVLELVKRLNHVDQASEQGLNIASAMTCILPMPQTVYTGDEDGRVVSQMLQPPVHEEYTDENPTVSMGLHPAT